MDIRNLGSFPNLAAVWQAYPSGGLEGDYLYIPNTSGVKYSWNKYARTWGNEDDPGTPSRQGNSVSDLNVQNELNVGSAADFHSDVHIRGKLYAEHVKQPNVGMFATLAALQAAYPHPEVGMWATVGDSMPGAVYRCNTAGTWTATGGTGGMDEIDNVLLYSQQSLTTSQQEQARENIGTVLAGGSDFVDADSTKRAKVATVGAILDHTDNEPTADSEKFVKSGGVYADTHLCNVPELNAFIADIVLKEGVDDPQSENYIDIANSTQVLFYYCKYVESANKYRNSVQVYTGGHWVGLFYKEYNTLAEAKADTGVLLDGQRCYVVLQNKDDVSGIVNATLTFYRDVTWGSLNEHPIIKELMMEQDVNDLQEIAINHRYSDTDRTNFSVEDNNGNAILNLQSYIETDVNGNVKTKGFDSSLLKTETDVASELKVEDNNGNAILKLQNYLHVDEYGNIKTKAFDSRQTTTNFYIIVDINGKGDYTSLQDAIDNAGDVQGGKAATIIVLPGTYIMTELTTQSQRSKYGRRNISIIGTDKNKCIIKGTNGYYYTGDENVGYGDSAPLKLSGNAYLANLTIISTDEDFTMPAGDTGSADTKHRAYCVHFDFASQGVGTCEIHNCVLINNHYACVGCGNRGKLIFTDCEMECTMYENNPVRGCVYVHDAPGEVYNNAELVIKNSILTGKSGAAITVANAYNNTMYMTFIGNVVFNDAGGAVLTSSSYDVKTKYCYDNNNAELNY